MGNRAVITTRENFDNNGVGVYLHWNGDRDSIESFLKYMKLRNFRAPDQDCYGWARLCQVIGNFFGGGLSIGIDTVNHLDMGNWDNGVYIIKGWDIVGREFFNGGEQNSYDIDEMLVDIDESQPYEEQLGKDFLSAKEVETSKIKVGDKVYISNYQGQYELQEVCGYGDGFVNGTNVTDIPYVSMYGYDYRANINNYLLANAYRIGGESNEQVCY